MQNPNWHACSDSTLSICILYMANVLLAHMTHTRSSVMANKYTLFYHLFKQNVNSDCQTLK